MRNRLTDFCSSSKWKPHWTKTEIEHRRKKHCHFKTLTKHAFKPLLWGSPVTFTQTSQNSHSRRENMEAYFGDQTFLSNSEHVHILTLEKCWCNRALTLLSPATVRHQHWLSFLPITRRNLIPGQVLGGGRQPEEFNMLRRSWQDKTALSGRTKASAHVTLLPCDFYIGPRICWWAVKWGSKAFP